MVGKTKTGFVFEVKDETLDDYELFEKLCEVDNGNIAVFPEMVKCLLGEEQTQNLKAHIREKEGRVSIAKMMEEVEQILHYDEEIKN